MALPGETLGTFAAPCFEHECPDCHTKMKLSVQQSNAGYYLGFFCACGPYSRETGYFRTAAEAQAVLDSENISWRQ